MLFCVGVQVVIQILHNGIWSFILNVENITKIRSKWQILSEMYGLFYLNWKRSTAIWLNVVYIIVSNIFITSDDFSILRWDCIWSYLSSDLVSIFLMRFRHSWVTSLPSGNTGPLVTCFSNFLWFESSKGNRPNTWMIKI